MGSGKQQGQLVLDPTQNPMTQIQAKLKELEESFSGWMDKQSAEVGGAVLTAAGAVLGGTIGSFNKSVVSGIVSLIPTPPSTSPIVSLNLHMWQRWAGKVFKRIQFFLVSNKMVASFGSGAMFSLANGKGQPGFMVASGLLFVFLHDKFSKFWEEFLAKKYNKTRSMLTNLGLENYEKIFKKGLLTDATLPLLDNSALIEVKIPPGPRLLILDHIQRDPTLKESRGS